MYLISITPDHELMIGSGMSGELKAYSFRNCLIWLITPRFSSKYHVENVDVMFSKYVVVEICSISTRHIPPRQADSFFDTQLTPHFLWPSKVHHLIQKKYCHHSLFDNSGDRSSQLFNSP